MLVAQSITMGKPQEGVVGRAQECGFVPSVGERPTTAAEYIQRKLERLNSTAGELNTKLNRIRRDDGQCTSSFLARLPIAHVGTPESDEGVLTPVERAAMARRVAVLERVQRARAIERSLQKEASDAHDHSAAILFASILAEASRPNTVIDSTSTFLLERSASVLAEAQAQALREGPSSEMLDMEALLQASRALRNEALVAGLSAGVASSLTGWLAD